MTRRFRHRLAMAVLAAAAPLRVRAPARGEGPPSDDESEIDFLDPFGGGEPPRAPDDLEEPDGAATDSRDIADPFSRGPDGKRSAEPTIGDFDSNLKDPFGRRAGPRRKPPAKRRRRGDLKTPFDRSEPRSIGDFSTDLKDPFGDRARRDDKPEPRSIDDFSTDLKDPFGDREPAPGVDLLPPNGDCVCNCPCDRPDRDDDGTFGP